MSTSLNQGAATASWPQETVQAFFEGLVWSGAPNPLTTLLPTLSGGNPESAMTMAVGRFFEAIAWDGQPSIGVPIAPIEAQNPPETPNPDLTLDDFSNLFG